VSVFQLQDHRGLPRLRCPFEVFPLGRFDLFDLCIDELQMRYLLFESCQSIRRTGAPRRARGIETSCHTAQFRIEATNAEVHEGSFHPIDQARTLAYRILTLAVWALRVPLFQRRNHSHVGVFFLVSRSAEKNLLELSDIQPVGLPPPMFARHRNDCPLLIKGDGKFADIILRSRHGTSLSVPSHRRCYLVACLHGIFAMMSGTRSGRAGLQHRKEECLP
jgi:hypothetical protein